MSDTSSELKLRFSLVVQNSNIHKSMLIMDLFHSSFWPIQRNLAEQQRHINKRVHKGYIRNSLIDIEPSCFPPDHLHLRKGLITRLFNQVQMKKP